MQPFVYSNPVTLMYGADNQDEFVRRVASLGTKALVVFDPSFEANGFLTPLMEALQAQGVTTVERQCPAFPSLAFVREQMGVCRNEGVSAVLGVGGGTAMDVSKTIAFGVRQERDVLDYLNYSTPYDGSDHLPVALVPTVPCSGSEMDDATQITVDETKEQFGLQGVYANVSWLNPAYVMTLPDAILTRSVMTSFVHSATAFLGVERSALAEDFALMYMDNIKANLRKVLDGEKDEETIGELMVTSAMHINGLTYLGKSADMSIYYLNGFVQTALGIPYTRAITTLFPYWLREVFHGQSVVRDFFRRVYGIPTDQPDGELLRQGLQAVKAMYEAFGIPTSGRQVRDVPVDYDALKSSLEAFGTIDSQYGELTPEVTFRMIRDCIEGDLL